MKFEKTAIVVLAAASVVFLVLSAASLYVFPMVDGYWWYGDETWLMLGWKNLLLHGRMVNPVAIGSTLTSSSGFIVGSSWISAILYGVPQLVTPFIIDIAHIGRTVTFILGLSTVFLLGWVGTRLKLSVLAVLLSIALLVSAKVFIIQSHSARYDIITGLTVLGIVARFSLIAKGRRLANASHWFEFGLVIALLAFGVSPHLEVLLLPLTLYIVWYFGAFRSWRNTAALIAGGATTIAVLIGVYAFCNSGFSLFGEAGHSNQFQNVVNNFPILHPFSRSAQMHQLGARAVYVTDGAAAFWLALPLLFASELALWRMDSTNRIRTFVFWSLVCVGFSSLFLQSTLPYYLVHILPLTCFAFALQLDSWKRNRVVRMLAPAASMALIVGLVLIEAPQLMNARAVGRILTQNNVAGVQAALEEIGRTPKDSVEKPFLLVQAIALSEVLRDTGYQVMNESFMMFSASRDPVDSVVSKAGVDYVIDYHLPLTSDYAQMIAHLGPPVFTRISHLDDRHVNYFTGALGPMDTLSVYEVEQ